MRATIADETKINDDAKTVAPRFFHHGAPGGLTRHCRFAALPRQRLFELPSEAQQRRFAQIATDELHADRQAGRREPARHRQAGHGGVGGRRAEVEPPKLVQRMLLGARRLLGVVDAWGTIPSVRRDDHVEAADGLDGLPTHLRPHLQGALVERRGQQRGQ